MGGLRGRFWGVEGEANKPANMQASKQANTADTGSRPLVVWFVLEKMFSAFASATTAQSEESMPV